MKPFETIENELIDRPPGWWERIVAAIPELVALADTKQPPEYHAEGDVAQHTRRAVEACSPGCNPDLLWAALLHDIGKPLVTRDEDDKIIARGHHIVGAEMAEKILQRLEMPPVRSERIVWVIRHHLFHLSCGFSKLNQPLHQGKERIVPSYKNFLIP